ncbi:hypothetical protein N665_4139s0002 [Sinapis alba]|nr:hypothetical protein N665_4139s0002 [Sinapis alba]
MGVHMPHNDPLLVELGIGNCKVTKVLVDTGSSVDLIFRDTLDKMGIDPLDMKLSSQSLTSFNGSSKTMLGTIHLTVYAYRVTRTVKFSFISTNTLWIHSIKAITSTYHQCLKFPGLDGQIKTLHSDQQAA